MWKKFLLLSVLTLGATGLFAGDVNMEANPSKVFVGVYGGYSWVGGSHKSSASASVDNNFSTAGLSYGLRLGAQNSEWRSMVTFDRFINEEAAYFLGQIHADYLLHFMDGYTEIGIKPFLGLNGGYGNYEAKGNISESGFTYGGETGIIFDVSENVDVDVMYQYTLSSAEAFNYVSNVKLGINYKY